MMKLLFENYQSLTLLPVPCYPFNFWWIQPVCLPILPEDDVIKMSRWWRLWYVHSFFYLPVFIPSPGEFFSCGPVAKRKWFMLGQRISCWNNFYAFQYHIKFGYVSTRGSKKESEQFDHYFQKCPSNLA